MESHLQKSELRKQIRKRRIDLPNRRQLGEQIQYAVENLPVCQSAQSVMVYVGYRSEVRTDALIPRLLEAGKTVYVPWCDEDELRLFRLETASELTPGAFGILEPPAELREDPKRAGQPSELDIVLVPGLAFDRAGGRLGQGKGYYDRLLSNVSDDCVIVGLAFDIQMVQRVPVEIHDIAIDFVVTELEVIVTRK